MWLHFNVSRKDQETHNRGIFTTDLSSFMSKFDFLFIHYLHSIIARGFIEFTMLPHCRHIHRSIWGWENKH